MLAAFDFVCERSAPCKEQGSPTSERIKALLDSLRASPVRVSTTDPDGQSIAVSADPVSLLSLTLSAATDWTVYRELDAAATSWLAGDRIRPHPPSHSRHRVHEQRLARHLLRRGRAVGDVLGLPHRVRHVGGARGASSRDRQRNRQGRPRTTRTPSLLGRPTSGGRQQQTSSSNPRRGRPRIASSLPRALSPDFPDVPVLVLSGDLDTLTPPSEGEGRRRALPELHVRDGGEHGPRHRARRLVGMRVGHRHRLHRRRQRGRHVVRGHDPRDPHGRPLLDHRPGRRPPPSRLPATPPRSRIARSPPSRSIRWAMRSRNGE